MTQPETAEAATRQRWQPRRARQRAGPLRDARPGKKPHRHRRERRHRLSVLDAARDAIDAARGSMIDPRGSVKAEPDEELLLRRTKATSRRVS